MKSRPHLVIAAIVLLNGLLSWMLLNPSGLDPISDEGAYATLAKALATTGEYRIVSMPGEPFHTKYPILYPWLLSLAWRVSPEFPANVGLLRWISVCSTMGFLFLLFCLLKADDKTWALIIVALCALHPAILSISVAILSEAVYLLLSTVALLTTTNLDRKPGNRRLLFLSALALALAFWVRIAGIALIAGTLFHFILKKKWAEVGLLTLMTSALLFPWFYWCQVHNESARFPEYTFYANYLSDFKQLIASHGLLPFVGRNLAYILVGIPKLMIYPFQANTHILTYLSAFLGSPTLTLTLLGFIRSLKERGSSIAHWYLIVYVCMLLLWPYPAGERFLVPLLPFLFLFVLVEVYRFMQQSQKHFERGSFGKIARSNSVAVVLALAILVVPATLSLSAHTVEFTINVHNEVRQFEFKNKDMIESFKWLERETAPSDYAMAYLDPVCYLYSGRKTAPMSFDVTRKLTDPKFVDLSIRKHGIKFLVSGDLDFGVFTPDVVQLMGQELRRVLEHDDGDLQFERVFRSSQGKYEIFGIKQE